MRKSGIALALALMLGLGGCASEPLYDFDDSSENTEIVDFEDSSESITPEEKESQYMDYLLNMCQEALKKLDGIEDISLDFGDEAEELKVKVKVAFEEAVGDKDTLKANIEKILTKMLSEWEGALIEFEEKETK